MILESSRGTLMRYHGLVQNEMHILITHTNIHMKRKSENGFTRRRSKMRKTCAFNPKWKCSGFGLRKRDTILGNGLMTFSRQEDAIYFEISGIIHSASEFDWYCDPVLFLTALLQTEFWWLGLVWRLFLWIVYIYLNRLLYLHHFIANAMVNNMSYFQ